VKKYFEPFYICQFDVSDNSLNPLSERKFLHQSTTWYGEGLAFTNSINLSASNLLLFKS
jgi:hypothetical protein